MLNKSLTLSIVIPVYNEQDYLKACLESIAAQSVAPNEVIVVDNNSTDDTLAIASEFSFVKIIKEPRQHQSFGQQTGFNQAKSDIIGRIDADSILSPDWVENVVGHFLLDQGLVGITGGTLPYDMAAKNASRRVFAGYNHLASKIAGSRMLWGANCAVRASAWQKISHKVTTRPNIWEDYDLSFLLAGLGYIKKVQDIDIACSFRAVHKPFLVQAEYQTRVLRTFRLHVGRVRTAGLAAIWFTMVGFFLLVRLDRYVLSPIANLLSQSKEPSVVASLDAE